MAKLGLLVGPLVLLLWVFCVVDVITARDARHLPKVGWLILVLLFPLVGSVAWLVAGRPSHGAPRPRANERQAPGFPEYDRPGRIAAQDLDADEEFLRRCRERAEEQRRRYREQQKRMRDADGEPQ
jgi:hypothetical protein